MANTTPTSSAYSVGVNPLTSEKSKQRMEIHTIHGYPVTVSLPRFPPPMLYHHDHGALPTTRNPNLSPVNGIQPGTPSPNLSTPPGPPIFTSPVRPAAVPFRSSPSTPQTIAFSSGSSLPTCSPAQFSNGSVDLQLSLHHLDTTEVSTDSGKPPYVLFSSLKVLKQKKQANIPSLGFGALVSPRKEISAGPQIIGRFPNWTVNPSPVRRMVPYRFDGQNKNRAFLFCLRQIERKERSIEEERLVEALLVLALLIRAQCIAKAIPLHCNWNNYGGIRPHSVSITEFGGIGDGTTLNTNAFQNAMFFLNSFSDKGGAKLYVPAGRWLTGSFDLISHLTLWLDKDAVILGSTNPEHWPIIDPLPSYGRGRELPGGRHQSLIFGRNLTDVVITGENGTIDGQGSIWWERFRNHTLDYTRPTLVEIMNSTRVVISNLTLLNSPMWTIHPVYCSQVIVQNVTIRAPPDSPNTDGIDPDSCTDVCIEDCHISTGDDIVAIKSGWDQYGISFARPSTNIIIRRLVGETQSSGIAIGSEMSGGISEVHAEDLRFSNSRQGVRIKTALGRGGYVRNIFISTMFLSNVKTAIRFSGLYGEHPDEDYDRNALPVIEKVTFKDIIGENVGLAGLMEGIEGDHFRDICLYNVSLDAKKKLPWRCSNIEGYSGLVSPKPCEPLRKTVWSNECYRLSNHRQVSQVRDEL